MSGTCDRGRGPGVGKGRSNDATARPPTPTPGPNAAARRFTATILRQGPNPYVDLPEAVSAAFAGHAVGGRIPFEGTLHGVSIRGSLVPVGGGRHRLYLNGGMRSAAQVAVGDAVTIELVPTRPDVVQPPADMLDGLSRAEGARAAFDALPPSHRRELLRFIDDARTPQTRQRRVQSTIEHVLGLPSHRGLSKPPPQVERPLWTCPKCGSSFVNPNQYHSCHRYEITDPFRGKPENIWQLFERFRAMVEACGPVTMVGYRDRVAFMVRVRFAGAVPRQRWLELGFWLTRRVEHPRFHKIETIYPNAHIHLLRVTEPKEIDEEVAEWVREAYAVGCQEHLGS